MKASYEHIVSWLEIVLSTKSLIIGNAILFGSVARSHPHPRDCDIAIVATGSPLSPNWIALRRFLQKVRSDFQKTFGFPLSILLLTPDEWFECGRTVVSDRLPLSLYNPTKTG